MIYFIVDQIIENVNDLEVANCYANIFENNVSRYFSKFYI